MVELKFATELIILILIEEMFFASIRVDGGDRRRCSYMSMCSSKGEKYYEVVKY